MSDVEEIKSRINIVDFVGGYVRLEKAGSNWKSKCPFHSDNSPSFMVSEEKQMWHCFGCSKGGDIFSFLMEMESLDFREALKILAERAGVELSNSGQDKNLSSDKNKVFEMLELATRFYEKQLWDGVGKENALKYLKERGLKEDVIRKFRIGFSPDGWNNIQNFLTQKGYGASDISKTGLLVEKARSYDRFRNRIMFPICDVMDKVIGFTSRALPGEDDQAKYINTPETIVYHKSNVLYGIEKAKQAIKEKDFVLLVEGNMDVMASHQAGIENVVAVSGTALTSEQLDILKRYTKNIKMFFDMDEAGQKAALRSAQIAFQKDLNVSIVSSNQGKDAADLVQENKDLFLKTVESSVEAMQYFFDGIFSKYDKRNVSHKKNIASELIDIIKNFSNEIEKHHWIKQLASEIDIDENVIADLLGRVDNFGNERIDRRGDLKVGSIEVRKRVDLIKEKIVGMIISDPEIWKRCVDDKKDELNKYLKDGNVKEIILSGGEKINFQFEKILNDITESDYLRRLYFSNQECQEDIEKTQEDKWNVLEGYFSELKKELKREKTQHITQAIKDAEVSGDKELILKLTQQLVEVSRKD